MGKTSQTIRLLPLAGMSVLLTAQTGNLVLPQDKGPNKIDVAAYPGEMQSAYKVFTSKCSKCHTIARPINTFMSRQGWDRCVKRMMRMPLSGISDRHGKTIVDFIIYDQVNRKDKNPAAFYRAYSD